MKTNTEEILNEALAPDENAGAEINNEILRMYRKENTMSNTKKNFSKLAVTICSLVLLCSVTAIAAIKYFTPSEIAMDFEDKTLAKAFESDSAILVNETQTFTDYTVTLLGIVSGEDLTDFVHYSDSASFELAAGRSYIVTAIEKTDGTPMPDTSDDSYGETSFFVSPYIKGENPAFVNAFTMNGGYSELVKDGIMYRLLDCDNIEIFADRGVCIGVISSSFYDNNAYIWNETDGTLTPNKDYEGVNALFTLPLNKEKAEPDAAKAYLDAVLNPEADTEENSERITDESAILTDKTEAVTVEFTENTKEATLKSIRPTSDNFDDYYTLLEDSVKNTKPDKENMIHYEYEGTDERSVNLSILFTELFPDNKLGISENVFLSGSDTDYWMTTYELMDDGSVIVRVYQSK